MARSIRDFHSDAEGRGHDQTSHDWHQNDQPDRTPESWLDRHTRADSPARTPSTPQKRGQTGAHPTRRTQQPAKAQKTNWIREVITRSQLRDEIRGPVSAIRQREPKLSDDAVAHRLRQRKETWRQANADDVRAVSTGTRQKSKPAGGAAATARSQGRSGQPGRKQRAKREAGPVRYFTHLFLFDVAVTARRIKAARPGISDQNLAAALARLGGEWSKVTDYVVQMALRRFPAHARPEVAGTRNNPPNLVRPDAVVPPSAVQSPPVRRTRSDICEACGVAFHSSGWCRCS